MYSIDDIEKLQKAVSVYRDELKDYYDYFVVAADACDQAMGSDPNAQRHIGRLNEALLKLNGAITLSEDLMFALAEDKRLAEETMYDD